MPTESNPPLQPTGSMQMWFYPVSRDFRYPVPTNFDFAYIDKTGKIAIRGPFGCARSFSNERAVVYVCELEMVGGKWRAKLERPIYPRWAIIDTAGNLVSPPQFRSIDTFTDSLASAVTDDQSSDSRYPFSEVFINPQGEVQAAPVASGDGHYRSFSEGLAPVRDFLTNTQTHAERIATSGAQQGWGYIDKNMNVAIPMQFADAEQFSEGLAVVTLTRPIEAMFQTLAGQGEASHSKALNKEETKKAIKERMAEYERMQQELKEPAAKSYIDKTGSVVIPGPFQQAKHFRGGFAAVKKHGMWGFIDRQGKTVIPFSYDFADNFGDGLALVEKDNKVGFVDSANRVVVPLRFADAQPFTEGIAAVTLDGTHWGYIDKSGAFVIEPTFKRAFPFNDGLALVFANSNGEWGTNRSEAPYFYFTARKAKINLQLETARAACDVAIRLDPASTWAEKCMRFKKIVLPSPEPSSSVLEKYRAGRLLRLKRSKEAETALKECIKDCPDFEWPYGELAALLIDEKRFDEAEVYLNEVLKRKPEYVRGYLWLSQIYLHKGDLEKATTLVARARSLDPDDELMAQLPPIPPSKAGNK